MAQTFKLFLVPGSVQFLAIGLVAGLACLYCGPRWQRLGRRWLTGLVAVYLFLTTPLGANVVTAPLSWGYGTVRQVSDAAGADTIVTLTTGALSYQSGDGFEVDSMNPSSAFNAMETARLYRVLGHPTVVLTGGTAPDSKQRRPESEIMAEGLAQLGVPRDRMVLETGSGTTREQAERSARVLRARGTRRFVLVTDSAHMPRALSVFREQGLDPIPSACTLRYTTYSGLFQQVRPALGAYMQSDRACYEYFARAYYWGRSLLGLSGE